MMHNEVLNTCTTTILLNKAAEKEQACCTMVKGSHRHRGEKRIPVKEIVHIIVLYDGTQSSSTNESYQQKLTMLGTELNAASIICQVEHAP